MALGFRLPLFCFLFALLAAGISSAAHSAPAPGVDCSSLILEMAECLPYVTEGGAAAKPSGGCCSGLKTVLKTDADCLCEAFKNSAQLGVTLNLTKALALPSVCHVSAPSVSNCALSNGAAPALSPFAVAPTSVAAAPSSSIGANEAAPAPSPGGGGKSGSNALVISTQLLLFTTVIAVSYALF